MVDDFKLALEQANQDPEVKAVVISVDSPGGEITASDVLYNSLEEVQQKQALRGVFQLHRGLGRLLHGLREPATSCATPRPSRVRSA